MDGGIAIAGVSIGAGLTALGGGTENSVMVVAVCGVVAIIWSVSDLKEK